MNLETSVGADIDDTTLDSPRRGDLGPEASETLSGEQDIQFAMSLVQEGLRNSSKEDKEKAMSGIGLLLSTLEVSLAGAITMRPLEVVERIKQELMQLRVSESKGNSIPGADIDDTSEE